MGKVGIGIILLCLVLTACIDEIYLSVPSSESNLVIDAWLGRTSEQSYVRVYRSAPFLSGTREPRYSKVPTSEIYVEDETGGRVYFRNTSDTTLAYWPSKGQVFPSGRKYRLHLTTQQGKYESDWVLMPEATTEGDFQIVAREKLVYVISGNTPIQVPGTTAELNLNLTNSSMEEVGYLIEAKGISEVFTTGGPENCVCNCYLDQPYIFTGMNLESSGTRNSPKPVTLAELEITSLGRFYLQSTIKTVSKANFDYLQQINKQQRSTGSIFDPAPFKIRGNVKNVNYPEQEVLGNFTVFQENTFNQMIYRAEIYRHYPELTFAFDLTPHLEAPDDSCHDVYEDALPETPEPFLP
ncbi:DUF4249 family protein [Algoriphagus aestuariicola]|uniref:DUF4249 family protein n=1 Tax=Algoriphagus aestuariicola TaxID=1852016 RepID=A0ABS3BRG3_9BACT|nr:DUF4249 family protein [Algoriphagus aestuariicola]MBN7800940.1 DUF4249 family protein [Algoriphagus aestuariicola]